jgi:DNA polymerase III subunit delta'
MTTPVPLQPLAWESLARAVAAGTVPPAYLFVGAPGVGKVEAALGLARALNCEGAGVAAGAEAGAGDLPVAPTMAAPAPVPCNTCRSCRRMLEGNHPNVRLIYPVPAPAAGRTSERQADDLEESLTEVLEARRSGKLFAFDPDRLWPGKRVSIQIDRVRGLKRELGYSLGEGRARVVVLAEAHTLTPEGSNALLKILEEPGPGTHWVLTTSRPNRILPTVRSRCRTLEFEPVALEPLTAFLRQRLGCEPELARAAAALAQGSPAAAVGLLQMGSSLLADRDAALELWKLAGSGQWGRVHGVVDSLRFRCYRDRGLVGRVLRFWLLWVRDLLQVKAGLPEAGLANPDKLVGLRRAAEQVPWETLSARYAVLEDCLAAEGLNVAPEVLLYSALTRLTEARAQSRPSPRQAS